MAPLSRHSLPWLIDTTLRDGEQAAGIAFARPDRLALARRLDEIGICEIEVGSPAMGQDEIESMRQTSALDLRCRLTAWCRAQETDLDGAARAGVDAAHISVPISDLHLQALGRDRRWVAERLAHLVPLARARFDYVSVGAQDASRTPVEVLVDLGRLVADLGAQRLRIADTAGVWHPLAVSEAVRTVHDRCPELELGIHAHDDLGMATANTLTALASGATSADVTVLGLGERAGNAALEQVVMGLPVSQGRPCSVDATELPRLCEHVATLIDMPIPPSRPVVGANAFRHESGIHVHAMLRDQRTYEAFAPEVVGRERPTFVIGRHSGRAALTHVLREQGIDLAPEELAPLVSRVRDLAAKNRRALTNDELRALLQSPTNGARGPLHPS